MTRIILAAAATRDLREAWEYIAVDSPDRADAFLNRLDELFETLASFPEMGTSREEFGPGLRSFPVGNHLVFYRLGDGTIEIARILSGYRDLSPLMT